MTDFIGRLLFAAHAMGVGILFLVISSWCELPHPWTRSPLQNAVNVRRALALATSLEAKAACGSRQASLSAKGLFFALFQQHHFQRRPSASSSKLVLTAAFSLQKK
ncbi:hypothetical protein [Bradyrhizobium icense]|uniref:Uncharacterized protein n=1 Tax=Bradyrhizobium icense TaxID=1274631 RepID=A0A1B1UEU5_9BRAD|nr:hypothetical protein [Bradyrhizobium icense]ANW01279.1 hypothetical protein LMTR13_14990 [Bradyrhizobium icense]